MSISAEFKRASVQSGAWRIGSQAVQLVLGIGSGALLARLLTPADFGVLAMVTPFAGFLASFKDFGLPLAAVQARELEDDALSALFWLNLRLSGGLLLFMLLLAPLLARFYGESRVTWIVLLIGLSMFAESLTNQSRSLLMRRMKFDQLVRLELAAQFAATAAAIAAALAGWGVWALVLQIVLLAVVKSGLIWWAAGWRPVRRPNRQLPINQMTRYGRDVTASRAVAQIGRNLDRVIVGYFSGAAVLGLYNNAYRWSLLPLQQLYTPLMGVAVSALSRVQDDAPLYRRYFGRGITPLLSIVTPTLVFLSAEARAAVLFLLGDQWVDAIPFFRLLCLAALAESLNKLIKWLYLSQGETRRQFAWSLLYMVGMVSALAIGVRQGAIGVAWAYTLASWGLLLPGLWLCLAVVPPTLGDLIGASWRPLLASAGALLALLPLPTLAPLPQLALSGVTFGVAYVALWVALPGGWRALQELLTLRQYLGRSES